MTRLADSVVPVRRVTDRIGAPALKRDGSAQPRDSALDFTKGVLVLLMVLYHWLNYFVGSQLDIYRYLRFLTPSFILVSGYLIATTYLPRYAPDDPRLHRRLAERGMKILLLFTALNVLVHELSGGDAAGFLRSAYAVYGTGRGRAAFDVLVPISYFLLLSPAILLAFHRSPRLLHGLTVAGLGVAVVLNATGWGNVNLELVSIGLLGFAIGTLRGELVGRMTSHFGWIAIAYALYLAAIVRWDVRLPLQIPGVCISVLAIYVAGVRAGRRNGIAQGIGVLGQYSLFAYIVHIFVLNGLRGIARALSIGSTVEPAAALGATLLATILAVMLLAYARRRIIGVDRLYRAVLA